MERWSGRVALVTGASAGIGAAIVKDLVRKGMKVVGVARRVDRVEALQAELKGAPGQLYPHKCDVTKEEDILNVFQWIKKTLGGVDVLVNNAGVARAEAHLVSADTQMWRDIIDTNLMALSICTREAVKSMQERGVDDGHIIHINSIAGHTVLNMPSVGMYTASKHGVTVLAEALRHELVTNKTRIRVTSISPGLVATEIFDASGMKEWGEEKMKESPHLKSEDISDAVLYVLGTPPHVQIQELTIKPTGEMF